MDGEEIGAEEVLDVCVGNGVHREVLHDHEGQVVVKGDHALVECTCVPTAGESEGGTVLMCDAELLANGDGSVECVASGYVACPRQCPPELNPCCRRQTSVPVLNNSPTFSDIYICMDTTTINSPLFPILRSTIHYTTMVPIQRNDKSDDVGTVYTQGQGHHNGELIGRLPYHVCSCPCCLDLF